MPANGQYRPIAQVADDDPLDAAFDDGEEQENQPLVMPTPATSHVPGAYDFEREYDYDHVPPGSPPRPSALALPNNIGNGNGLIPDPGAVAPPGPSRSFFRRAVGALLPIHYSRIPDNEPTVVRGSGNDGVWANVMAKPVRGRPVTTVNGETITLPEDSAKEAPPTYQDAQLDAVPTYWETTTVHAPGLENGDILIEDLSAGTLSIFLGSAAVSWFFQFVGFLLTYLLHNTHAGKLGSRAGLGLTLIQYGLVSRSGSTGSDTGSDGESEAAPEWPGLRRAAEPSEADANHGLVDLAVGGISYKDWLSFLLMTVGWFLLLSSLIGFWRIKRWESGIRASATPPTAEEVERDRAVRRNLENVFGYNFDDEEETRAHRRYRNEDGVRADGNGNIVVIPSQAALEEARLNRDLRAAGLL
ncbi:hypothetical protein HMN09_00432200 [Mycena chlorophos]|uniref:Metal homeostatis protein bsd2 n=1 Tax=Mycena chlorophos TaxID=658473 RepID=A0A8H6TE69_MYCCL|nr:hypothetical protein HMN09_00432200 [Mycena chlorophos]